MFRQLLSSAAVLIGVSLSASALASDPTYGMTLTADQPASVTLSNRDMNRIVCLGGRMGQTRFSAEKGIATDQSDDELFVKFMIRQQGQQQTYVTDRSEFFITCGGETFTLYATPRDVPSQTLFLKAQEELASAVAEEFAPLSQEDRALKITRAVITEDYPESFRPRTISNRVIRPFPGVAAQLGRAFEIDGLPLYVEEYVVRVTNGVRLDERMFLRPDFGSGIHAITIEEPELQSGAGTRVIIVKHQRGRS